ncbi:MAG: archaeosortase/exosortase family protein [Paludibacteraceae bacterium]|nr:archaeosortase/exosortase family protein [Paludibacteraceae bacterium]
MSTLSDIKKTLAPYYGILYFVVILAVSHFFWKFTMIGDESDNYVSFFGINLSALFQFGADHVAEATTAVLNFFGINAQLEPFNVIRHDNRQAVRVVWSCTGFKQAYIFASIIALYRGPFLKKLWYIPAGLVLVYAFNIFRIAMISAITRVHPDWFYILHEHLFKYMYYAMIFGLWLIWEERIAKPIVTKNPEK